MAAPPESFVYLEIAEAVRRAIVSGELKAGQRLPPVREMAKRWRCTPNTVSRAYALLAREGLISSHRGGGTRVIFGSVGGAAPESPGWQWASLVNRAEQYLLEAVSLGQTPAHAESALAAAISRWEEMQDRAGPVTHDGTSYPAAGQLIFAGSHDLSVELLCRLLSEREPPVLVSVDFVGSLGGLIALARGEADFAGSHLWDQATEQYNVPFVQRVLPNRRVVLLNLVQRVMGMIVPPGNPLGLHGIPDLATPGVVLVNRQPGSGTRVWLDVQLKVAGIDPASVPGYEREESTHLAVSRAVADGEATVGIGIGAAAAAYGLDFMPLGQERYDLVIPEENWASPEVGALRDVVESAKFKDAVLDMGGYDVSQTGTVQVVS
jgi:putative molybdopterin biosynthesis protein